MEDFILQFVYLTNRKIRKSEPCHFPPADFSPQVAHPKLKIASAQSAKNHTRTRCASLFLTL
ncbi:hypothetical protein ACFS5M_12685, partial [Lacinutrix iliipiscaria]